MQSNLLQKRCLSVSLTLQNYIEIVNLRRKKYKIGLEPASSTYSKLKMQIRDQF